MHHRHKLVVILVWLQMLTYFLHMYLNIIIYMEILTILGVPSYTNVILSHVQGGFYILYFTPCTGQNWHQ